MDKEKIKEYEKAIGWSLGIFFALMTLGCIIDKNYIYGFILIGVIAILIVPIDSLKEYSLHIPVWAGIKVLIVLMALIMVEQTDKPPVPTEQRVVSETSASVPEVYQKPISDRSDVSEVNKPREGLRYER